MNIQRRTQTGTRKQIPGYARTPAAHATPGLSRGGGNRSGKSTAHDKKRRPGYNQNRHPAKASIPNPFDSAALWFVKRFYQEHGGPGGRIFRRNQALSQELMELGTGKKNCVQDYYVQKISRFLMVSTFCLLVLSLVLVKQLRQDRRIADGTLERPGYGEGGRDQNLLLQVGSDESESFDIYLDARTYTSAQVRTMLDHAASSLDTMLSGDNESLDEVRNPLCLPSTLEDGAVSIEYYITPGGMIDEDGSICGQPDEDGTLVMITASLTCQDKTSTYECAARIFPPILTAEDQFRKNVRTAVDKARKADPTGTKVQLPSNVDGRKLHWSYPKDSSLTLIMILMLVLPIAFWAREDSKIHDQAKARQAQLELDYSQVLWKLTMLLSAGLTIRGAFTRIAAQYEAESEGKHREKRYVYEEMLLTIREMNSGVPEASAYENFGRRCSLPMYIKLGSLLSQNLKKGSKGLTTLLEHEAVLSMDQHKMAVRKLGERATVKMLLPMILMFGVVLVILMVPAFLSM